jgi:hypothetical protein
MFVEVVSEYFIDPGLVADFYAKEFEEFLASSDDEDVYDFALFMLGSLGVDKVVEDLGLEVEGRFERVL